MKSALYLVFVVAALWAGMPNVWGQSTKKIEILSSDALQSAEAHGQKANMLKGNVRLKQEDVILACDSAMFYINVNAVDAFGHVVITQGDSLEIRSDSLKYNGDTKIADLYSNVQMRQGNMHLTTKRLTYWMDTKIAIYFDGGHLVNDEVDLTSNKGYYYSATKMSYFRQNVVLKSPDYTLYADTLGYNTGTKISYFYGPTRIVTDTTTIYCETGWYNSITNISSFGANTILDNPPQKLWTDSLYYERETGLGKAFKKFTWRDTTMNVLMSGRRADFNQNDDHIVATDHALLTYVMDSDSLFLVADTLVSLIGQDSIRKLYAFHHVRIYKTDLQGLCDSMFFNFKDSVMWMYYKPVLWNEVNQLTGDTITMTMKDQQIKQVEMFKNGFVVNQSDPDMYNQIKGKHIYGYFTDGHLTSMYAKGNGESLYYAKDDSGAYMGINKATCSNIWLYIDSNQINKVKFVGQPDAVFLSLLKTSVRDQLLKGFQWRDVERPRSKADILDYKRAVAADNKSKQTNIAQFLQYLNLLLSIGL